MYNEEDFANVGGWAGQTTLVLGDMDFSFSRALVEKAGVDPALVLATTLNSLPDDESTEFFLSSDIKAAVQPGSSAEGGSTAPCVPEAAMGALEENLSALSQTGVPAYHSVDAMNLHETLLVPGPFGIVVYLLPHLPGTRGEDPTNSAYLRDVFAVLCSYAERSVQLLLTAQQFVEWDVAGVAVDNDFECVARVKLPTGFYDVRDSTGEHAAVRDLFLFVFQRPG
jgi:hypothetical protein